MQCLNCRHPIWQFYGQPIEGTPLNTGLQPTGRWNHQPLRLKPHVGIATTMFTFADASRFVTVLDLEVPWAHSYADMSPGKTDRERRERFRKAASGNLLATPANPLWWAFRITVQKAGRALDIDNVAKTIIDSFCAAQIARDESSFTELRLYPDDTFDHVRILQVMGSRSDTSDSTRIEIFACVRE